MRKPSSLHTTTQATNQAASALSQKAASRLNDQIAAAANAAGKVASAVTSKIVTNTVHGVTQVGGGLIGRVDFLARGCSMIMR